MPTYVYRCRKCKHRFERFHSITDETAKRCPRCRGKAERVPAGSGGGILFKGSGFYITDYRSKSYQEKAKREKSGGSSAGPPGESADPSSGGPPGGSSRGPPGGSSRGSSGGPSGGPPGGPPGGSSRGSSGGSSGSGDGSSGGA
jgi:putative FmdB family regulatory protein